MIIVLLTLLVIISAICRFKVNWLRIIRLVFLNVQVSKHFIKFVFDVGPKCGKLNDVGPMCGKLKLNLYLS